MKRSIKRRNIKNKSRKKKSRIRSSKSRKLKGGGQKIKNPSFIQVKKSLEKHRRTETSYKKGLSFTSSDSNTQIEGNTYDKSLLISEQEEEEESPNLIKIKKFSDDTEEYNQIAIIFPDKKGKPIINFFSGIFKGKYSIKEINGDGSQHNKNCGDIFPCNFVIKKISDA